jgi:glycosyltransferase involved in cell wall biosynthesis
MKVTLALTVKNEATTIGPLLESVGFQTRWPDEIIIVDGGSTDGTPALIRAVTEELPLHLIAVPGANISQGRNAAIEAATGDIVAITDSGVILDPRWLEELIKPFEAPDGNEIDVVSGFFHSDPQTAFELALGATTLPEAGEIDPYTFLPSSRSVAFRKSAWRAAGGYPEWLDYCEDLIFDLNLQSRGFTFRFRPEAVVHFRPRQNLKAFFTQYYRYARGDGKAGLWTKRHLIRYTVYIGTFALVGHALYHRQKWLLALPLAGAGWYVRTPYMRLFNQWKDKVLYLPRRAEVLAMVPVIRLTGDVAKMLGYPVGLWWRLSMRDRRAAR